MGWTLNQVQPSGTSGSQGLAGTDGSKIILFADVGDGNPLNQGATETGVTKIYARFYINTETFKLWSIGASVDGSQTASYVDQGTFAGDDGLDGAGYSGASYDAGTGQVTFTGAGGNTNVVTGDLRGSDGSHGSTPNYLTGSGAPTDSVTGADGDVYVDTDNGDFYGPRTAGAWGSSSLNIQGTDGVDVSSATAGTGDLIITLSDATEINAGSVLGADGSTPTFTIGSVTTGSAGTEAIVQIDGASTPTNQILNFTIPSGADGQAGADGADGQTITQEAEVTTDTGSIGDLSSINGSLYQKRIVDHVGLINISIADFTPDDTTLDPNGNYLFTNFTTDSQGNEYARYALERNDGSPSPDYIIQYDEGEEEWELKANTNPSPSPLYQCKANPSTDGINCSFYPVESNWAKNIANYPNSTEGLVTQTSTLETYIEYNTTHAFLDGSDTNQSDKTAITIPQVVGYVRDVPYYGAFHTMDGGQKMTGGSHSDLSENITSTTTGVWAENQLLISANRSCEFLVYVKTGTGIVVTDDESIGIGSDFIGAYALESSQHNSKNAWKNSANKYISWDGSAWAFRDAVDGVSARSISTQDIADPSDLTQQEANLINIYPERKTLTFDAFTQGVSSSHTNTGVDENDIITIGGSVTRLPLYLTDLIGESGYPTIYIQLLTREDDIKLTAEVTEYKNAKECWQNLTDASQSAYDTLGSLDNVNTLADQPPLDRSMIVWSSVDQEWVLAENYSTSWHNGNIDPVAGFGNEGDYFINNTTKDIFRKINNTWVSQFNTATGADGIGIESVEENDGSVGGKPQYSLTFTFTDETTFTTSALKGDTGANGSAGGLPTGGGGDTTGTGSGNTPWTPTEVSSSVLWVDSSKTASVVKSGSDVTTWVDAYLQGNSMVAVGSSTIATESFTGDDADFTPLDVVALDAVTDSMTSSTNFGTTDKDFFVCGIFEIRENTQGKIFDLGNGATTGSFLVELNGVEELVLSVIDNSNASFSHSLGVSVSVGDKFIISINVREEDYVVRLNGADIATQSANIRGAINSKQASIGDPAGVDSLLSRHCEWIIGSEHLTDQNVILTEGYLAHKWGVTEELPSAHDHKTILPEIAGGSQGQLLAKVGDGDYEVAWVDPVPYNKFIKTGFVDSFDVLSNHHGSNILITNTSEAVDLILPYNPADGWQVFMIHRNANFPVRILAYDSGNGTESIIPDAGWGSDGDITTTCFLKDQGDSCSATWDKASGKWYVQGNLRTYAEAYDLQGVAVNNGGY